MRHELNKRGKKPTIFLAKNCRGQIAKTITWVIATIIIVLILVISVFLVSFIKKDKQFSIIKWNDLLAAKSLSAFLLSKDISGGIILKQLQKDEEISYTNNWLFNLIFKRLYDKDFPERISLDISSTSLDDKNFFLSLRPAPMIGGTLYSATHVSEKVIFKDKTLTKDNKDKYLELTLMYE